MRRAAGLRNLNSSALHGVVLNSTLSNSFGSKRFSLSKSLIVLPKILFRVRVDPIWHLVRGRIAPWTGRKSVSVHQLRRTTIDTYNHFYTNLRLWTVGRNRCKPNQGIKPPMWSLRWFVDMRPGHKEGCIFAGQACLFFFSTELRNNIFISQHWKRIFLDIPYSLMVYLQSLGCISKRILINLFGRPLTPSIFTHIEAAADERSQKAKSCLSGLYVTFLRSV